jgi:hypothetical protein
VAKISREILLGRQKRRVIDCSARQDFIEYCIVFFWRTRHYPLDSDVANRGRRCNSKEAKELRWPNYVRVWRWSGEDMTHGVAIPSTQAVSKLTCSTIWRPYQMRDRDRLAACDSKWKGATENSRSLRRVRIHLPLPHTAFYFTPWLTWRDLVVLQ